MALGLAEPMDYNRLYKSATLPLLRSSADAFWHVINLLRKTRNAVPEKSAVCGPRILFTLSFGNSGHALHFKCINGQENIWSARITLNYRALGILEGDTVTSFWIGKHDDYERFFS